ncbi:MAG: hypothetical protein R3181_01320, partial [Rubricoccaceae bacterium]|nr:hypothetical protein [Rubricoccaceae bacterium]
MRNAYPLLFSLAALLLALPAQAQTDYMDVATEADLLDGGTLAEVDIACIDRAADGTFVFFNTPSDELVSYDPDAAPGSRTTILRTNAELLTDTGVTVTACRALDIADDGAVIAALAGADNLDFVYRLDGGTATVLTDPASLGDNGDGVTGLDVDGSTVYLARSAFFGAPEDGFYSLDATTAGQDPTAILQNADLDLYDVAAGDDGCLYSNSSEFGGTGFVNVTVSVCDLDTTPVLSVVYDPFADGIFTNGSDGGLEDIELGPAGIYLFNNSFGATEGEQWGFVEYGGTGGVQFANETALVADADVSLLAYTAPSGTHTILQDGVIYEASSSSFGGTDGIVKFTDIPGAPGCEAKFTSADLAYDAGTRRLSVTGGVRNNGADPVPLRLELRYNRDGG